MHKRLAGLGLAAAVFACLLVLCLLCVSPAQGQTAGTGAITGTVTDPSGKSVPNATVTATSVGTGQVRTATTGSAGDYKFSLLPPGDYQLKFSASGFKTSDVGPVTVNVTETSTQNQSLQVGAISESVTVEANIQTLQTESATLGTTVTGSQISALPMANGNYTEILSLSSGTSASVDNATSVGKGTQNISANGVNPGSNNFQMDGVAVNNIANSGNANDGTIYTGIPIPSTDAIAEFKVQTSTYDASFGRNPGANVVVSTKGGTNRFHGSGFESFRNSILNADDYFFLKTPGEPHQIFNQNQFGGTIGGPIKKDKLFFFFSYRGTRSKNGVAAQGKTDGAFLPTALNPYAALGSRGTCNTPTAIPDYGSIASECDATAQAFASALGITNVVGLRIYQLTTGSTAGVANNYYLPAPSSDPQFCQPSTDTEEVCNFSVPAIYNENQYVANGDYVINSKNTLTTKYFYQAAPQTLYLGQAGGYLPGDPVKTPWGNQAALMKLTSTVTNTFVNEARVSYQRNDGSATIGVVPDGCPTAACGSAAALGIQQFPSSFIQPPTIIDIIDNFSMFGGLLPFKGPTNQVQVADQISWQHGRHTIRAGFENEWTNWPLTDQGLQEGLLLLLGTSSLYTGGDAGPGWNVGLIYTLKGSVPGENGIIHFYDLDNRSTFVQDDWKVSSRLTLNMGLRWEFDGLLSDRGGRLTQVWLERMAPAQDVPLAFSTDPVGIQQYVVPSNFVAHFGEPPTGVGFAPNSHTITGHAPYSNFAPRFGFAWQPLKSTKLVVRGGAGIFYDRTGLDLVVHAYETGSPYAATYDYPFLSSRWAQATLAAPYPHIQLICMPTDPNCNTDNGEGFAPRFSDSETGADSGLSAEVDPNSVHTPLVREYNLDTQYEFAQGWVLDVAYVGSTGINLSDFNHNHNQATLYAPCSAADITGTCASDPNGICTGTTLANAICNTAANAQFRVPYPGYTTYGLQGNENDGYSNYNSLQVTLKHQFGHGLSMQAAFTWDKDLSTVFFTGEGSSANVNEALCMRCQYGRVSFDRPRRFVVNYSYDLPFGKETSGLAGKLISGWNVSGITIAQSGDPLTFIAASAPTGPTALPALVTGAAYGASTTAGVNGVSTAQYCPGFSDKNVLTSGSVESRLGVGVEGDTQPYYNPNAFCPAPIVPYGDATASAFGNSGIGVALGPGQFNWDISILKNTKLTEWLTMQFRTDFYNAFNHPQFADPGGSSFATSGFVDIAQGSASHITVTNVNPRLIQFGVHFLF
ncbi:MAG TPA: carboxypeptidase-like regulatory domain-containing protein [Candidatus Aquilonibacter sp.]|nr:carboxypeptidase-like regulatory domain-containing protein [Candidatus Aquilonibacter sp.]